MRREETIRSLRHQLELDLLIIGGGATGCGLALDAASRGLKTALVERWDFAEGTSSRSSKLIHGGVRYLEAAIRNLDRSQWNLVREGLCERNTLLRIAPALCRPLPLVVPLYHLHRLFYLYPGLKLYDWLAGKSRLPHARLLGRKETLQWLPHLNPRKLKGGILYYDARFDDARMALSLALRADEFGASVSNYLEVCALRKHQGKVSGVRLRDHMSGEEFDVRARVVINATGPFCDELRKLDRPGIDAMLKPSTGTHLVLKCPGPPPKAALLIPETSDGRVIFAIPWQAHLLLGTTDRPGEVERHPLSSQEDMDYLLEHLNGYMAKAFRREDILSRWTGVRPLLKELNPDAETSGLSRDYRLEISDSGLVTVTGGKWTSYRLMAEKCLDRIVERFSLQPEQPCRTASLLLEPPADEKTATPALSGLDAEILDSLRSRYGARLAALLQLAEDGWETRLHPDYPYLEGEVLYAVRCEMARRPLDFLARRTPLALLDLTAAQYALPRTTELMAAELCWPKEKAARELAEALRILQTAL